MPFRELQSICMEHRKTKRQRCGGIHVNHETLARRLCRSYPSKVRQERSKEKRNSRSKRKSRKRAVPFIDSRRDMPPRDTARAARASEREGSRETARNAERAAWEEREAERAQAAEAVREAEAAATEEAASAKEAAEKRAAEEAARLAAEAKKRAAEEAARLAAEAKGRAENTLIELGVQTGVDFKYIVDYYKGTIATITPKLDDIGIASCNPLSVSQKWDLIQNVNIARTEIEEVVYNEHSALCQSDNGGDPSGPTAEEAFVAALSPEKIAAWDTLQEKQKILSKMSIVMGHDEFQKVQTIFGSDKSVRLNDDTSATLTLALRGKAIYSNMTVCYNAGDNLSYAQHTRTMQPFKYQMSLAAASKNTRNTLVVSSTGSGKTVIYMYLLRYWVQMYSDAVFIVLVKDRKSVDNEISKMETQADFFSDFIRDKKVIGIKDSTTDVKLQAGHIYYVSSSNTHAHRVLETRHGMHVYYIVDEVHELFEHQLRTLNHAPVCGRDGGTGKGCKLKWSKELETSRHEKCFALTATPLLCPPNKNEKFKAFFENGIYYYYALDDRVMPKLTMPPKVLPINFTDADISKGQVPKTYLSEPKLNIVDYGILGKTDLWFVPDKTRDAIVELFLQRRRPKTLIIVDSPATSVRLANSLLKLSDGKLKETHIYCGGKTRSHMGGDEKKWYVSRPNENFKRATSSSATILQNDLDMMDVKIREAFNNDTSNAIYVVSRVPYATGPDYMGVQLLLRSPTTTTTQEMQLQGRVTRICGFTPQQIQDPKLIQPIEHVIFQGMANGKTGRAFKMLKHEVLPEISNEQRCFFENSENKDWVGAPPLLLANVELEPAIQDDTPTHSNNPHRKGLYELSIICKGDESEKNLTRTVTNMIPATGVYLDSIERKTGVYMNLGFEFLNLNNINEDYGDAIGVGSRDESHVMDSGRVLSQLLKQVPSDSALKQSVEKLKNNKLYYNIFLAILLGNIKNEQQWHEYFVNSKYQGFVDLFQPDGTVVRNSNIGFTQTNSQVASAIVGYRPKIIIDKTQDPTPTDNHQLAYPMVKYFADEVVVTDVHFKEVNSVSAMSDTTTRIESRGFTVTFVDDTTLRFDVALLSASCGKTWDGKANKRSKKAYLDMMKEWHNDLGRITAASNSLKAYIYHKDKNVALITQLSVVDVVQPSQGGSRGQTG